MQRFLSALAVVAFAASPLLAADAKFALDGENTSIKWVGTKSDGKHEGTFKKLTGAATGDAADPTKLQIDLTIDTESLTSDNEKLTAHLKSPDFFDVKRYPRATFKSTKIEKSAEGFKVTGDLTLLGKKKSVSFPAKIALSDASLKLDGKLEIDRTQFGMTYGEGKVDAKVGLTVAVNAKQK